MKKKIYFLLPPVRPSLPFAAINRRPSLSSPSVRSQQPPPLLLFSSSFVRRRRLDQAENENPSLFSSSSFPFRPLKPKPPLQPSAAVYVAKQGRRVTFCPPPCDPLSRSAPLDRGVHRVRLFLSPFTEAEPNRHPFFSSSSQKLPLQPSAAA